MPPTGRPRAYGYTLDGDIVEDEAALIRDAARRLLEDPHATYSSEARRLNAAGVPAPAGGKWHPSTLSRLMVAPRLVGDRPPVRGGKARPILDRATYDQLVARHAAATRHQARRPDTGLVSGGLADCGRCGAPLALAGPAAARVYRCPHNRITPSGRISCSRLQVHAAPLEEHIREKVLAAWDGNRMLAAALAAGPGPEAARITAELDALNNELAGMSSRRHDGLLTDEEWERVRRRAATRRDTLNRQLAEAQATALPGPDTDAAAWWQSASITARRALVAALYERVTVRPALDAGGSPGIDPRRVVFTPRTLALAAAG